MLTACIQERIIKIIHLTYYLAIKSLRAVCICVLVCVVAEAFGLTHPDSYHYLRQSSCLPDKTINDNGTFQDVLVRRKLAVS